MSDDATGSGLGGVTGGRVAAGASSGGTPNGGASRLGRLVSGLPLPVHDHETPSTGGELDGYLHTAWAEDHVAPGADAHPEYATDVGLAAVQAQLEAVYTEAEADARFEQLTRKGAGDGYAPLDAGGLVPTAHLPPLAVTDTLVAGSEGAMLTLSAQVGDICIRSDLAKTFILATDPASTLANWLEMAAAGQVISVNGETGVVSLDAADVGAAAAGHTHPSTASEQWRFQNNTTVGDPGDGYLRSNTGVLSTATIISLSRTTQDGYDVPPSGFGVVAGDTVYIQDRNDNSKWVRCTANEPLARFATYVTGSVTVTGSAGAIAHGQIVQVTFSLAGGGGGGGGGAGELAADALWDAKGDLVAASGANAAARLPLGTNGQVLTVDSAQTLGVKWAAAAGGLSTDPLADAKGDLFAASAADTVGRLALGTTGQVLTADSAQTLGVKWAAPATGAYLPLAGGTLTGPLLLTPGYVALPGASTTATSHVYGGSPPAPSAVGGSNYEKGVRFRSTAAGTMTAVRWWRVDAGSTPPGADGVRLWDTTNTASPVWSTTALSAFTAAGTGWKEQVLPAGTGPVLVAGRDYVLSYSLWSGSYTQSGYTPVPEAPLVFVGHVYRNGIGGYPSNADNACWLDPVVEVVTAAAPAATAGGVRLPNGSAGAVAWRNAANTADLSLTMDGSDRLAVAVGTGALTTSATAGVASALPATPAAYLTVVVNGTPRKLALYD